MLVHEAGRSGSVLASDVSPAALHRTGAGYYREREMRGVSAARRREHFDVVDGGWQANQRLRDMVSVQRHNLLDPIPPQVAECHVVMCRNVLIYFTQRHAELFLERLADVMDPGAYLFIGGAETVWHVTDRFEPIQTGACFAYRPRKHRAGARPLVALTAVPVVAAARMPAPSTIVVTSRSTSSSESKAGGPQIAEHSELPIEAAGDDHERIGGQLLAGGSVREAIVTFRQWAYLSPENPAAHLQLALALDRADERSTAGRAYRAALTALDRCSPDRLPHVLQGYERSELRRLLVDRSSARGAALDAAAPATTPPPAQREGPAVRS
jgi:chemotaxis protein methyltransferase CheR